MADKRTNVLQFQQFFAETLKLILGWCGLGYMERVPGCNYAIRQELRSYRSALKKRNDCFVETFFAVGNL